MTIQWDIILTGHVQDVGMRLMVREMAQKMKLSGTVYNAGNNNVKIHVVGTESILKDFKKWLVSNPGSSRIEDIVVRESKPGTFDDFSITY